MTLTLAWLKRNTVYRFPGGYGGGATPVPIPNTAVKPSCADGTAALPWWESRTLPGIFLRPGIYQDAGPFFCARVPRRRHRAKRAEQAVRYSL